MIDLQQIIDIACETGTPAEVPPGQHVITAPLTVPNVACLRLLGAGVGLTTIRNGGFAGPLLLADDIAQAALAVMCHEPSPEHMAERAAVIADRMLVQHRERWP